MSTSDSGRKRRKRKALSCSTCRKRKIRCDRERPCGHCVKNNLSSSCVYDDPDWFKDQNSSPFQQFSINTFHAKVATNNDDDGRNSSEQTKFLQLKFRANTSVSANDQDSRTKANLTNISEAKVKTEKSNNLPDQEATYSDADTNSEDESPSMATSTGLNDADKAKITKVDFYEGAHTIRVKNLKHKVFFVSPLSGPFTVKTCFYGRIMIKFLADYRHHMDKLKQMSNDKVTRDSMCNFFGSSSPHTRKKFYETRKFLFDNVEERKGSVNLMYTSSTSNYFVDNAQDLAKEINAILPPKEIITLYVERFFKFVYPFIPILDQKYFHGRCREILYSDEGEIDTASKVKIRFKRTEDILDVGMLLMVLKLGFMSVYSYKVRSDTYQVGGEVDCLLSYPITATCSNLAKRCFSNFQFLRKSGIDIIVFLHLIKFHNRVAFDETDGVGNFESNIFSGLIVSSSYSMGLHRDPEHGIANVERLGEDKARIVQLWKKLWLYTVNTDVESAMNCNSILMINQEVANVSLPDSEVSFHATHHEDLNMEKDVIDYMIVKHDLNEHLTNLLKKVLSCKGDQSLADIETAMKPIVEYCDFSFPRASELISDYKKRKQLKLPKYDSRVSLKIVRRMKHYFSIMEFLFSLKAQLFLKLEALGDEYKELAFNYRVDLIQSALEYILIYRFWVFKGPGYISDFYSYQYLFVSGDISYTRKFSKYLMLLVIKLTSFKYGLLSPSKSSIALKTMTQLHFIINTISRYIFYIRSVSASYQNLYYICFKNQIISWMCINSLVPPEAGIPNNLQLMFKEAHMDEAQRPKFFKNQLNNDDLRIINKSFTIMQKYAHLEIDLSELPDGVPIDIGKISIPRDLDGTELKSAPGTVLTAGDIEKTWYKLDAKYGGSERTVPILKFLVDDSIKLNLTNFDYHIGGARTRPNDDTLGKKLERDSVGTESSMENKANKDQFGRGIGIDSEAPHRVPEISENNSTGFVPGPSFGCPISMSYGMNQPNFYRPPISPPQPPTAPSVPPAPPAPPAIHLQSAAKEQVMKEVYTPYTSMDTASTVSSSTKEKFEDLVSFRDQVSAVPLENEDIFSNHDSLKFDDDMFNLMSINEEDIFYNGFR